jgi:hypothetical protein
MTSSGFEMSAWTAGARPPSAVIVPGFRQFTVEFSRKGLKPAAKEASTQGNLSGSASADLVPAAASVPCVYLVYRPQPEADTNPMPLTW